MTRRARFFCFPLLLVTLAGLVSADPKVPTPDSLVSSHEGDLPILLSAPHGGTTEIPGIPRRKGEGLPRGGAGFFAGTDTNVDRVAEATSTVLERKTGKKPYVVIARFRRTQVDANRPPAIGYEDPRAQPYYDAYHDALARYATAIRKRWGRGLLLDIHGQASARDMLFRGTQNGKTVSLLVQRFGEKAQNGPESLFGLFASRGWKVFPAHGEKERSGFTGGYIVKTYSDPEKYGLDAVQLEFGGDYRSRDQIGTTAASLSDAVLDFAHRYLPEREIREGN
jgi:N-formylglutamate amidohydrolase